MEPGWPDYSLGEFAIILVIAAVFAAGVIGYLEMVSGE